MDGDPSGESASGQNGALEDTQQQRGTSVAQDDDEDQVVMRAEG